MTKIFETKDYKDYVRKWLKSQPKQGHGKLRAIAAHLQVNSVIVSQVFNGDRDLTQEQALRLCEYLGLNDIETDYFLTSVLQEKAGTSTLKKYYEKKLKELQLRATQIENVVAKGSALTVDEKAKFYSEWTYSACRLLTSIQGIQNVDSISRYLNISYGKASRILEFLTKTGLVVETPRGFDLGATSTHVSTDSPFFLNHHRNWRHQSLKAAENMNPETDLFFTAPMSLSNELMTKLRKDLLAFIEDFYKKVSVSRSEQLACMNLDLFTVRGINAL